ncbi:MAG: ABC transporter substrate-binding protein, partial [Actinobacteria bacterium]|nr:ABC transporter substrate-binding protein [Actinomycetota bacterium]
MKKRLALLVAALSLVAAACGSDTKEKDSAGQTQSPAAEARVITIALGGPFSGTSKATGDKIRAGAKVAADEINGAGGVKSGPM